MKPLVYLGSDMSPRKNKSKAKPQKPKPHGYEGKDKQGKK